MTEKRIAETINVRINVGNYQHIELTKYGERTITYDTPEEMKEKEDALTDELLDNLIRNMRRIPDKLGKKTEGVAEVEQAITKSIPTWLEEDPVPNIANRAKDNHDATTADQRAQKDTEDDLGFDDDTVKTAPKEEEVLEETLEDDDDLF